MQSSNGALSPHVVDGAFGKQRALGASVRHISDRHRALQRTQLGGARQRDRVGEREIAPDGAGGPGHEERRFHVHDRRVRGACLPALRARHRVVDRDRQPGLRRRRVDRLEHDAGRLRRESCLVPRTSDANTQRVRPRRHASNSRHLVIEAREPCRIGLPPSLTDLRRHCRCVPSVRKERGVRVRRGILRPDRLVEPQRDDGRAVEASVLPVPISREQLDRLES